MAYYILDESGLIIGTDDVGGARCTAVAIPDNSTHPPRFINGAWAIIETENKFVTELAFYSRFTAAERAAIRREQPRNAIVADFMMLAAAARHIDLGLAETIAGVDYLATIGVLNEERAEMILNDPINDAERP